MLSLFIIFYKNFFQKNLLKNTEVFLLQLL